MSFPVPPLARCHISPKWGQLAVWITSMYNIYNLYRIFKPAESWEDVKIQELFFLFFFFSSSSSSSSPPPPPPPPSWGDCVVERTLKFKSYLFFSVYGLLHMRSWPEYSTVVMSFPVPPLARCHISPKWGQLAVWITSMYNIYNLYRIFKPAESWEDVKIQELFFFFFSFLLLLLLLLLFLLCLYMVSYTCGHDQNTLQ